MTWVATAIVGGSVITGLIGSNASSSASNVQAGATDRAAQLANNQFEETRSDQAPWREAGAAALGQLSDMASTPGKFTYNDLYSDPSYQFRLDQGLKAVQRSAAARGGLLSGGTLKGLNDYAQGAASQEYGQAYGRWNDTQTNTFNRLASVAGLGQTANQSTAAAGAQASGTIGNLLTQGANAQAAGIIGSSNAWTGAANNGMNTWMQYKMLQKLGG